MKYKVMLKRTTYAEVEVEAKSKAEVRRLLADDSDAARDAWSAAQTFWADEVRVIMVLNPGEG